MKEGGNGPEVINDDDGNPHVGREISQQAGVGIEAPGRTADANDGKVFPTLFMRCPHRP